MKFLALIVLLSSSIACAEMGQMVPSGRYFHSYKPWESAPVGLDEEEYNRLSHMIDATFGDNLCCAEAEAKKMRTLLLETIGTPTARILWADIVELRTNYKNMMKVMKDKRWAKAKLKSMGNI